MNKTFLKGSIRAKFLGYATTTKFGNDVTYSLAKHKTPFMHIQPPGAIDHLAVAAYEVRQHETEGNKWGHEFQKLQSDLRKLYRVIRHHYDSSMKNKIQSNLEYDTVQDMKDVNRLLTSIKKICLSTDTSKYYVLQGFIAQKRLFNF